jgi:Recombination endonuclease VII
VTEEKLPHKKKPRKPEAKCPHGRQRSKCKPCGGVGICQHGRRRVRCKECGGVSICSHGRQRHQCKECGGASICHHGKERRRCKECGGVGICEHARVRSTCKECGGASVCHHGRRRNQCFVCDPQHWAKSCIQSSTGRALKLGYAPPAITPDEAVALAQRSKQCALCGSDLDWQASRYPSLHHNHETGKVIGFVDHRCNNLEGLGKTEEARTFREFTYVRDEVSDVCINGVWVNGILRGQR